MLYVANLKSYINICLLSLLIFIINRVSYVFTTILFICGTEVNLMHFKPFIYTSMMKFDFITSIEIEFFLISVI